LQRTEVGRRLDQDRACRVDQHFAEQIERLLRTGDDEDLARADRDAVLGIACGYPLAQRHVAFRCAVLECGGRRLARHALAGVAQPLDRERDRRGQAARERDDFGPFGDFQDLADGGAREFACALGNAPIRVRLIAVIHETSP
jgi:hypothetical protein